MRLLYFAPHVSWPLTTGARLRDYHLARQLGMHCSLSFVGLRAPSEQEPASPPADCHFERNITLARGKAYTPLKIVKGLAGPEPITLLNYFDPAAGARLGRLVDELEIDAVQLESVHLLPYLPFIRAARRRPSVLADWHNIESELMYRFAGNTHSMARRLVARRTAVLIERSENGLLASCRIHTVTSEREQVEMMRRAPGADIRVVPNGVDAGYYARTAPAAAQQTAPAVLFVGSMDYHANIDAVTWFVRKIWPELKQRHPAMRFFIVGRNPPAEVRNLACAAIEVTGTVDDVRPWYARAAAVVVPIRTGSGTRLKILEAMAAGVPVVSTRVGAEGLSVEDGVNIVLADREAEIVRGLDRVISSEPLAHQLCESGKKLVTERYDWSIPGGQLYRIHCEMLT
jgi:polysaccharide biosynthesis protein PslH